MTLREAAQEREQRSLVGREAEMAFLRQLLQEGAPLVAFVYGVAGIGKSTLLSAFAGAVRERGGTVLRIDCAAIEPTDRGFLSEFRQAAAVEEGTDPLARIHALGPPVTILVDTYEAFRISDAWFRQVFLPGLPPSVRVVVAGREAPMLPWFGHLGWSGALAVLELGPLEEHDALELLRATGLTPEQARRTNRVARGHPLALRVVSAMARSSGTETLPDELVAQQVIEQVAQPYLDQLDPPTRRALEAASVVRRATRSLLRAMLDDASQQGAFERLLGLTFIRETADGLAIHETVQQAVSTRLRAEDPARHRRYQQAAWRQLQAEVRLAGEPELWRYTADMIFLLENPIIREAFFPATAQVCTVEPARREDGPAIIETITRHEAPRAASIGHAWWERAPQTFRVVRDRAGVVTGFYQIFEAGAIPSRAWPSDPIALAWVEHATRNGRKNDELVLFLRRELDRDQGEAPGPVQAAVFLDIKRIYMTMRPRLRRVYWTARSVLDFMPALTPLGFVAPPELAVTLDGQAHPTVMLDFGPGSVDGWLARIAASELGIPQDELLDLEARELVSEDARVPLTRLEFSLLHYLMQRHGTVVTRADLMRDVWGYSYVGDSNVVEVGVRALRRKLGQRSGIVETVRGVGYRYRRP